MGQIIGSAAKPKRCNLNQLSQVPTPAAGEHILVSSDNSMNAAGQGYFDSYIIGDGTTAATALELKSVDTLIGTFDISEYHATGDVLAKYSDLAAALDGGNNIPHSVRKGGMSVKFVRSSDNKYVQYRLMSDTFNTTVANWQGVDSEPIIGSHNLVESGGAYNQIYQRTGQLNGFTMFSDKYIDATGNFTTAFGWSTTGWININNIGIVNDIIELSQTTIGYSTSIYPLLFKDSNNIITTSSTSGNSYSSSIIPSGTKYIAFNFHSLFDYLYINKISDILNDIIEDFSEIAEFKYIGTTNNPLDQSLTSGLYAVDKNSSNVPSDYNVNNYGWLLVVKTDFKLLWNQSKSVFWAYLQSNGVWYNMSGSAYEQSYSLTEKVIDLLNTAITSGVFSLSGTPETIVQSYPKHVIGYNYANLSPVDDATYNVDKYTVIPGTIYRVVASKRYDSCVFAIYDENDNCLRKEGTGTSDIQIYDGLVLMPPTASYILVAYKTNLNTGSLSIPTIEKVTPDFKWSGKKWVAVGDSLTEVNSRTTKNYLAYISEKTGISVVNMGLSGSGYRRKYDTNQAFYQRVANIQTDADVITIFGSGNDLGLTDYVLGSPTDTGTDTICGCINNTLDTILSVYMNADKVPVIGVITPTPWINNEPSDNGRMVAYSAAIIECCERKSIPVLDLFHKSNLHPDNATFRTLAYSKDEGNGVHPDERGHQIIAPMIENFLENLIL